MGEDPQISLNDVNMNRAAGFGGLTAPMPPLLSVARIETPKPFKLNPPKQITSTQLVGDAMTALIREYGLAAKSTCSCKSWAGKLNEWGVAGCREHRAEIVAHLGEAYHAATWWDTFKAAGSAVYHSLPLTLGGMVDEAIRRAETSPGNSQALQW